MAKVVINKIKYHNPKMLSVIVPAYNCKTIYKDLFSIQKYLKTIRNSYEIICVVDGQKSKKDKTKKHALRAKNKHIKVYSYKKNKGKGYAIRLGMSYAKVDLLLSTQVRCKPFWFRLALEHMKWYKADIIIGSKRHKASRVSYHRGKFYLFKGNKLFLA
jgi:dolichyl-phosphate beta-glucosyltransferase